MSFLETYVNKYRLDKIKPQEKKHLHDIETQLDQSVNKISSNRSFLEIIKIHGDDIADLVERVGSHFDNWKFTIKKSISSFRFVINIAIEIYQMVENISSSLVSENMDNVEKESVKTQFGVDLVWYVWSIVNPINKRFRWIPFKKVFEKKIVKWLARMGISASRDLFKANEKKVDSFVAINITKRVLVKSL